MHLFESRLFLLLTTGLLLGLYFPIGKLAMAGGADPIMWAAMISIVPGALLLVANFIGDKSPWKTSHIPFGIAAGLLAYVLPNTLVFASIPHIGSGLVSLSFAFSPVFTAALSMILKVRPPDRPLLAGVALGFAGFVIIALGRTALSPDKLSLFWLLAAAFIPVSLAAGNVFRTAAWPADMTPLRMAAVANTGATVLFLPLLAFAARDNWRETLSANSGLAALQCLVSAAMFAVFFRLQKVGGPTYLSQIGYVSAAVGLAAGAIFLGERYGWPVWAGAALIALGVAASNWPGQSKA
ncbi:MAG: DMT family transporter [Rhizobiales bacterium]|nr:DMT family transporter [Hyphomicrobiales bacterium]